MLTFFSHGLGSLEALAGEIVHLGEVAHGHVRR